MDIERHSGVKIITQTLTYLGEVGGNCIYGHGYLDTFRARLIGGRVSMSVLRLMELLFVSFRNFQNGVFSQLFILLSGTHGIDVIRDQLVKCVRGKDVVGCYKFRIRSAGDVGIFGGIRAPFY